MRVCQFRHYGTIFKGSSKDAGTLQPRDTSFTNTGVYVNSCWSRGRGCGAKFGIAWYVWKVGSVHGECVVCVNAAWIQALATCTAPVEEIRTHE